LVGCTEQIQDDLNERSANEIVAVLALESVVARKVSSGEAWAIEVAASQVSRGLAVLTERGLPRRQTSYDVLIEASGGLVPSADEERRRSTALAEVGLEETLLALEGVYDAHVHAVIPQSEARGLSRDAPRTPRVSVVLIERSTRPAPPDEAIVAIVMGAVDGITPETIAIVRSMISLPDAPEAELEVVGPFVVASESAGLLKLSLLGLSALGMALASALIVSAVRRG
jgi:type III secretion protein J